MHNPHEKNLPTQTNKSSDKLLLVMEAMAQAGQPLRLQDVAAQCGMNASTTLRFLTALVRRNYAAQDIATGRYYLTLKLCALAQNVQDRFDLRGIATPFLNNVSHIFGESCNLATCPSCT